MNKTMKDQQKLEVLNVKLSEAVAAEDKKTATAIRKQIREVKNELKNLVIEISTITTTVIVNEVEYFVLSEVAKLAKLPMKNISEKIEIITVASLGAKKLVKKEDLVDVTFSNTKSDKTCKFVVGEATPKTENNEKIEKIEKIEKTDKSEKIAEFVRKINEVKLLTGDVKKEEKININQNRECYELVFHLFNDPRNASTKKMVGIGTLESLSFLSLNKWVDKTIARLDSFDLSSEQKEIISKRIKTVRDISSGKIKERSFVRWDDQAKKTVTLEFFGYDSIDGFERGGKAKAEDFETFGELFEFNQDMRSIMRLLEFEKTLYTSSDLEVTKKLYTNKKAAKKWLTDLLKISHPDQGNLNQDLAEEATRSLNKIYKRIVG